MSIRIFRTVPVDIGATVQQYDANDAVGVATEIPEVPSEGLIRAAYIRDIANDILSTSDIQIIIFDDEVVGSDNDSSAFNLTSAEAQKVQAVINIVGAAGITYEDFGNTDVVAFRNDLAIPYKANSANAVWIQLKVGVSSTAFTPAAGGITVELVIEY